MGRRGRGADGRTSVRGMTVRIDLNADLGESFGTWLLGDDEAMLDVVTSANVACGFHAGDATTMPPHRAPRPPSAGSSSAPRSATATSPASAAAASTWTPADLTADVLYQLGALEAMCRVAGTRVAYVKPHGALYNAAVHRRGPGPRGRRCRRRLRPGAAAPRPAGLGAACASPRRPGCRRRRGVRRPRVHRRRPPRAPRRSPGALLTDPDAVADRVRPARDRRHGPAVDGTVVAVAGPVASARTATRPAPSRWPARCARRLEAAGVTIAPFVAPSP